MTGLRKTFVFQEARAGTAHRFAAHNAAGMVSAQEGLIGAMTKVPGWGNECP